MGTGTRAQEIRQRRQRKLKRRKQRRHKLVEAIKPGRTREDRLKLAHEFRQKMKAAAG
jgi:hypothetical protein